MTLHQLPPCLTYGQGDQPVPGYTLVRRLGEGSMGVVWLARNDRGFELAIKIVGLDHSGGRKEWRGLAVVRQRRIRHGNLLRVYDYWLKDKHGNIIPDLDPPPLAGTVTAPLRPGTGPAPLAATTPVSLASTDIEDDQAPSDATGTKTTAAAVAGALEASQGSATKGNVATLGGTPPRKTTHSAPTVAGAPFTPPPARSDAVQLIIAMDLGNGGTLHELREKFYESRGTGLPVDELLGYMQQAANGLDYLHAAGIVHRDIKPQNIMLVGNVATICDYGLVMTTESDLKGTTNAFTLPYASPEALDWKPGAPLTGSTDLYSLAVTYYELRTGRLPFLQDTMTSVYSAKQTGNYDLSRVKNKAVRNVLKRALAHNPEGRYTTCTEFVKELERTERSGLGIPWAAVAAAAAAVAVVAAGYLRFQSGGSKAESPPGGQTPPVAVVRSQPFQEPKNKINSPDVPSTLPPQPDVSHTELQAAARKIIETTRSKSDSLLRDPSLAEPFVEVIARKASWGTVLTAAEQSSLRALHGDLERQISNSPEPIPKLWLELLPDLLHPKDLPTVLRQRLTQRAAQGNWEQFRAAETDLTVALELAGVSGQDPALAEISKLRVELLSKLLPAELENDSWATDASARLALFEKLEAAKGFERDLPLAALLLLELEMADLDAAGQRYPAELRRKCERLVQQQGSTPWRDYALFLAARSKTNAEGVSGAMRGSLNEQGPALLLWHDSSAPWHTPRREAQAQAVLVQAAESLLKIDQPGDVLQTFGTSDRNVRQAIEYVEGALKLSGEVTDAEGLWAIAHAVAATQENSAVNWPRIAQLASKVQTAWSTATGPTGDQRRRTVGLANALAIAYLPGQHTSADRSTALSTFYSFLKSAYNPNSPAQENDQLVYRLVAVPASLFDPGGPNPPDKEKLAAAFAAKGRLLERDNRNVLIGTEKDQYTESILEASKAYQRARELSTELEYAAGYGRTILKLPRDHFNSRQSLFQKELSAISKQYEGQKGNQSCALIAAWMAWDQAKRAASTAEFISNSQEALRLYQTVVDGTINEDAYGLAIPALNEVGTIHVYLAFHNPGSHGPINLQISDEELAKKPPLELSRYEHLRRAVMLAKRASQDGNNRQPDKALLTMGNALEDLAYYCKQLDYYPEATEAFRDAMRKAVLHSKVYARLSLGRCLYRWSIEPGDKASRDERQGRLREAYQLLTEAVEAASMEETPDAAEAHLWLSHVLMEAANSGPGNIAEPKPGVNPRHAEALMALLKRPASPDTAEELKTRVVLFQNARVESARAAELAESSALADRPIYLRSWMQHDATLCDALSVPRLAQLFPKELTLAALSVEISQQAETILSLAQQNSRLVHDRTALIALKNLVNAKSRPGLAASATAEAVAAIRKHEGLFQQPDVLNQRVEVVLLELNCTSGADASSIKRQKAIIDNAEQLALQVVNPLLRDRSLALCSMRRAEMGRGEFENLPADERKRVVAKPEDFDRYLQPYDKAQTLLARAAGAETADAYSQLLQQSLAAIERGQFLKEEGAALRAQQLRDLLQENSPLRNSFVRLLENWSGNLAGAGQRPLSEPNRKIGEYLRRCLIERAFLRDGSLDARGRKNLEDLERLGVGKN